MHSQIKIKSGEGQHSHFSPLLPRIVMLPHGVIVIRGGGAEKPPELLIFNLQIYGDVPSSCNNFYSPQQG